MLYLLRRRPQSLSLLRPLFSPTYATNAAPSQPAGSKFPEYEMPSVTWGAIQGKKERLVSRVIITDYLKQLGIDVPEELAAVELPSTVEVMRERVEFLQRLGLTIDDLNTYPLLLACSLRKNIIPVLSYLEKLGIPRRNLGNFTRRYPMDWSGWFRL